MSSRSTFFLLKPDGVQKGLFNKIREILFKNGIQIDSFKECQPDINLWMLHYKDHCDKPFFNDLCREMSDKPVIAMKISLTNSESEASPKEACWQICRRLLGSTDPSKADPNTIRGKFGTSIRGNIAHTSDSLENAQAELSLWGF